MSSNPGYFEKGVLNVTLLKNSNKFHVAKLDFVFSL